MLKAYAVAVALTTTVPVTSTEEVGAKPVDNQSMKTEVKKGFKRGGVIIFPSESVEAKKGFKRGGVIIFPN